MKALPLKVQEWLNTTEGYNLDVTAPRVKVIHAFQMLCPGCVYHGIPQTIELFERLKGHDIDVVGLHTVFENHHAMGPEALKVFIKEWRLPFPVGIDEHKDGKWMPETMKAYDLQGTPTTIVIDQQGEVRVQHFGIIDTEQLINFVLELSKQTLTNKQA
ncbi:peroxiredoxin family protein [Bdellovibrio sp. HCB209]|uniref:peroxiredoxin family protein n=1 Tax=Bdellovibrio sp. HCB209 TaxID=3394354 RepID=UPI0039B6B11D